MQALAKSISVIIPIGPDEQAWPDLLGDLDAVLPLQAEIILVGPGVVNLPAVPTPPDRAPHGRAPRRYSLVKSQPGRAHQLNLGAKVAGGRFLWFLHADTRLDAAAVKALQHSLAAAPQALHWFDLKFHDGGPWLMPVNAALANLRADMLGLPFGDQGLCMARQSFFAAGGYDEQAPYGEDHLLVWQARRVGISLKRVGAQLSTSARKYQQHGWFKTTLRHQQLTWWQALPQWIKLKTIHT